MPNSIGNHHNHCNRSSPGDVELDLLELGYFPHSFLYPAVLGFELFFIYPRSFRHRRLAIGGFADVMEEPIYCLIESEEH